MTLDIKKMANVMLNYSTKSQAGETILLYATSPVAEPMIQELYQEALQIGAYAFPYISLRDEAALALEATDNLELLATVNPMLETMYLKSDVVIYLAAEENPRGMMDYPFEKTHALAQRGSKLRDAMIRRTGKGDLRRCSAFYPTNGYAMRAGMSLLQYENFFNQGCKLHLADPIGAWKEMARQQQVWVDYLKDKKVLHVRGKHVDLKMSIAGRKFINSSGRANFPDGEIFTCPVEDSVSGWVRYTFPAYYGANEVDGVELEFEQGLVVSAKAEKNQNYLTSMLATDDGAKRLGEFAFGTNYDIQRFSGSIVFDEKIGGTMHTALGMAYRQTGGENTSNIHWDMICDLRTDSEALADGELFYKNGNFIF